MNSIALQEFDEVIVTGRASSPHHDFDRLRAVVATVADDAFKVWPQEGQPDPDGTGKIWFFWTDVTALEVIKQVTVIDKYGRTQEGGLVLDAECLKALTHLLCKRCGPHDYLRLMALANAAEELGRVLYERTGLSFEVHT